MHHIFSHVNILIIIMFSFLKQMVPGAIGEVLSTPVIGVPVIGHTDTFLSIGKFADAQEASACLNYVKTKFARCLLGTLKATQHNPRDTWANVPLQNFTAISDIGLDSKHCRHR